MPVIIEEEVEIEKEIEPEVESSQSSEEPEPEQEINTISGRQPYIEQLRMLSREELERRLGEHMQHQFLEELRSELNRRNLIPINGRQQQQIHPPISRSTSGSTRSGQRVSTLASPPPVAPQPDYYHQEEML